MAVTPPQSPRSSSTTNLTSPLPILSTEAENIAQKTFELTKEGMNSFSEEQLREAFEFSKHQIVLNQIDKTLDAFLELRKPPNPLETNSEDAKNFETYNKVIQIATRRLNDPLNPWSDDQQYQLAELLEKTKGKLAQAKAQLGPRNVIQAKTDNIFCYAMAALAIGIGVYISLETFLNR